MVGYSSWQIIMGSFGKISGKILFKFPALCYSNVKFDRRGIRFAKLRLVNQILVCQIEQ